MAAVARNRYSEEYGDTVDAAHAHYRRKYTCCVLLANLLIWPNAERI